MIQDSPDMNSGEDKGGLDYLMMRQILDFLAFLGLFSVFLSSIILQI